MLRSFISIFMVSLILFSLQGMNSTQKTKFYIEKPYDIHGNTCYKMMVILAKDKGATIKVIEPNSFSVLWKNFSKNNFIECDGPVRELSKAEYMRLVLQYAPQLSVSH